MLLSNLSSDLSETKRHLDQSETSQASWPVPYSLWSSAHSGKMPVNQKWRKDVIQMVLNLKNGSISVENLPALVFQELPWGINWKWESRAVPTTADKLSGSCMAHRHRSGRVRERKVWMRNEICKWDQKFKNDWNEWNFLRPWQVCTRNTSWLLN